MSSPWERLLAKLIGPVFRRLEQLQAEQGRLDDRLQAEQGVQAQARAQFQQAADEQAAKLQQFHDDLLREKRRRDAERDGLLRAEGAARESLAEQLRTEASAQAARAGEAAGRLAAAQAEVTNRLSEESAVRARELAALSDQLAGNVAAAESRAGERLAQESRAFSERLVAEAARFASESARHESALGELAATGERWKAEVDRRAADLSARLAGEAAERAAALAALAARAQEAARAAESRLGGLESRLARVEDPVGPAFDYSGFEDRFRGAEALIRERHAVYLELLRGRAPVADLGCGRGELLQVLAAAGVEALGVEADAGQAARAAGNRLAVERADLREWLAARPAGSLGAVTLLQVIEHFDLRDQVQVISEAHRALRPGGALLIETVNPHCPEAAEWFYIDPTHRRPVYPEMMQFLMERSGFTGVTTRFQVPCSTAPAGEPPNHKTGGDFAVWGYRP